MSAFFSPLSLLGLEKTETRTASIFMDENQIVHVTILDGIKMDYEDSLDIYLVIKSLLDGRKNACKLIDARANWSIERKARKFLKQKDIKDQTRARAIIHGTALSSLLATFFFSLISSEVPTKVFSDYDEGYAWLLEMQNAGNK